MDPRCDWETVSFNRRRRVRPGLGYSCAAIHGGEELRLAAAELCPHRLIWGTEDFSGDGGGGHERFHELADVGEMLQRGVGVSVPLEDDRLALVVVEEHLVLQGPGVSGSHDLHGLLSQALPLVELAGVDLHPCDALDLLHRATSVRPSEE